MRIVDFILDYKALKGFFTQLVIVQARLMPLFLMLPLMNRSMVPRTISLGLVAGLGLLVVPTLPAVDQLPVGAPLLWLLLKEAVVGLVLGFLAAIPFWVFDVMGFVIDNQRGASMAATVNPLTGHDSSPLGMLFSFAFLTFFFVAGGFQVLLSMVYESYRLWPPLSFWPQPTDDLAQLLMSQINRLMLLGLLLAAPAMVAMLLSEVGLALVSRFAPQLQVFFLAMPVKSGVALFVLIIYVPTLFDFSYGPIREMGQWVRQLDARIGGR